jgi:antitoxin MazE
MTAIQLRAELFREMNPLLDSEVAMTKVIAFVKNLVVAQRKETGLATREGWAAAAKQAHIDGEDKLMAADVFEDEGMEDWKW